MALLKVTAIVPGETPAFVPPSAGEVAFTSGTTVKVSVATVEALPATSVAFTLTVYEPPAGKLPLGKAYDQAVVPVAARRTGVVLAKDVPSQ